MSRGLRPPTGAGRGLRAAYVLPAGHVAPGVRLSPGAGSAPSLVTELDEAWVALFGPGAEREQAVGQVSLGCPGPPFTHLPALLPFTGSHLRPSVVPCAQGRRRLNPEYGWFAALETLRKAGPEGSLGVTLSGRQLGS